MEARIKEVNATLKRHGAPVRVTNTGGVPVRGVGGRTFESINRTKTKKTNSKLKIIIN